MIARPPNAVFATPYAISDGDEVVGERPAPILAGVHGREEQEEENREEEDEDRALAAAPEDELVGRT